MFNPLLPTHMHKEPDFLNPQISVETSASFHDISEEEKHGFSLIGYEYTKPLDPAMETIFGFLISTFLTYLNIDSFVPFTLLGYCFS